MKNDRPTEEGIGSMPIHRWMKNEFGRMAMKRKNQTTEEEKEESDAGRWLPIHPQTAMFYEKKKIFAESLRMDRLWSDSAKHQTKKKTKASNKDDDRSRTVQAESSEEATSSHTQRLPSLTIFEFKCSLSCSKSLIPLPYLRRQIF